MSAGVPAAAWPAAAAKLGTVTLGGDLEAGAQVALAPAEAGRVDGQRERDEAGVGRLVDQRAGHAAVAEARRAGTSAARRAPPRRPRPGSRSRASTGTITVPAAAAARAMPGSPSGWAIRWKATGATSSGIETGVPSTVVSVVAALDVDQRARSQPPAREGLDVVAQRALVAGAAGEVAVGAGIEPLAREPLVVGDVAGLDRQPLGRGRPLAGRSPDTSGT